MFNRLLFNRSLFNRILALLGEVEIIRLFGSLHSAKHLIGSIKDTSNLNAILSSIENLKARVDSEYDLYGSFESVDLLEAEIKVLVKLLGKYLE